MKAVVYKSTGSWYVVQTPDGKFIKSRIKGVFKIDGLTSSNPIAVGDEVEIELENDADDTAMIYAITERKNYIIRQSPGKRINHMIVAANLDQCLLFATLKNPRTSSGFIDRFLTVSEAYHIPAILVFNKADLYRQKEMDRFAELNAIYTSCGYKVMLVSLASDKDFPETIKGLLLNKTTLISGHSGVGKSTFINYLLPEKGIRTSEVSDWSGKGLHTTTFAEMFDLPFGGRIIDTPGVREFGLVDISKGELAHYFPEMRRLMNGCRFNNCMHINEADCAIKAALETGEVSVERYVNYLSILDTIEGKKY